jgi:hypothetical protein
MSEATRAPRTILGWPLRRVVGFHAGLLVVATVAVGLWPQGGGGSTSLPTTGRGTEAVAAQASPDGSYSCAERSAAPDGTGTAVGGSGSAGTREAIYQGTGVTAISDNRLLNVDPATGRRGVAGFTDYAGVTLDRPEQEQAGAPAVLRHAASDPSLGSVAVLDRLGADELLLFEGDEEPTVLPASGEVHHPAVSIAGDVAWGEDYRQIVLQRAGAEAQRLAAPQPGMLLHSPTFDRRGHLIAVAGFDVPTGATAENLYRWDDASGAWVALTQFVESGTRASYLRTPVVSPSGQVLFVRTHGETAAFRASGFTFELWRSGRQGPELVRALPNERYLVDVLPDRSLVWNGYDETGVFAHLYREGPGGGLVDLGCGEARVDPRSMVDPDATPAPEPVEIPEHWDAVDAPNAIKVGDFSSEQDALAVAARLRTDVAEPYVATAEDAPAAIAPGYWAVLVELPAHTDYATELAAFRGDNPRYRAQAFIVGL